MTAYQINQQRGNQRAVHDQARVALDRRHILAVVMDAVAVESQCRVAKQQYIVGRDLALPDRSFFSRHGRRHRVARLGGGAINDVVRFAQRQPAGVMHFMRHQHEQQIAAAPSLVRDRFDA